MDGIHTHAHTTSKIKMTGKSDSLLKLEELSGDGSSRSVLSGAFDPLLMHLQRVGFGFGWLYSFHVRTAFVLNGDSRPSVKDDPQKIMVPAPCLLRFCVLLPAWGGVFYLASILSSSRYMFYVLASFRVVDVCVILLR